MAGHQNRQRWKARVRATPGWQVIIDEWAHSSTAKRAPSGTNNLPGGPLPRPGFSQSAARTVTSISQVSLPSSYVLHDSTAPQIEKTDPAGKEQVLR
ncbi:hypothetical protein DPEC_G00198870 [Dallia pectoralis]|uniref:Uncharacterized protein n=1 Tax=Dallia pectoralis TaxID=75939 RepID=A0ACC2G8C1_DALPE|nr:hypothetical protein DPEC_G00198870 [Dallia pectoralis]